ncbi:hypothetical protein KUTeg_023085 [Tegillarca granosa]|uniref:Protein YIPF3 n=1 Tax=Tegillarca granosa TaxID=220873 RepID=A0ABQ9E690_TEGGR|nr:hypothetical protein KUTeg_023085 [Tegillarca granosa]
MADTSNSWSSQQGMNQSAVINLSDVGEMEIVNDEGDQSDYETGFADSPKQDKNGKGVQEEARQRIGQHVTEMFWNAGKQQAKKAWSLYGNIDILRPYFNVEPHEVRARLLMSLIPQKPTNERQRVYRELYGPLMVIFTLIALLLFQMKTAEHKVEEGTLMGTAFGVCFTYWFGAAALVWFLAYVCNTRIAMLQILSMMGYSLVGHCLVLFLGTLIHTSHDHLFFYLLWAVIGGISALKMVCIVVSRTHGQSQRLIVCGAIVTLHLLFLLYLHFAYHQIVEDLSDTFNSDLQLKIEPANLQNKDVNEAVKKVTFSALHGAKQLVNSPAAEGLHKVVSKSVAGDIKHVVADQKAMLMGNQTKF